MITRVARGRLRPNSEARAFELLRKVTADAPPTPGLISMTISRRAAEQYVELISVTVWDDVDAMAAALGPRWREPSWLSGLVDAVISSDLEIYETVMLGYENRVKLMLPDDAG